MNSVPNMNLIDQSSDDRELGEEVTTADQVATPGGRSVIIKGIPGPDSPLVFKIVPQKRSNGKSEGYWAITKHTHLVGDGDPKNKKNYRSHLCQKTAGQSDCPECDKYYDIQRELYDLEKAGKKGTTEYLRLKTRADAIAPQQKGWLLVVLPDNPEVKALCVGKDVLNKLFGKAATKWKPAVESLITKMAADGNDPYNLRSSVGWIKLYKEGEGRDTTYTVQAAATTMQVTLPNGKQGPATVPAEFPVHDAVFKTKRSDLPNLGKFEERSVWKKEWSKYMSENFHAPAEALENQGGSPEENEDPLSVNAVSDIPAAQGLPVMPPAEPQPVTKATDIDQML